MVVVLEVAQDRARLFQGVISLAFQYGLLASPDSDLVVKERHNLRNM